MGTRKVALAAVLGLGFITGCSTFGTLQTASPIGMGKTQFALEPGVWGVVSAEGSAVLPRADIAIRYGVSDTFEIGGRIGGSAIEITTKFLLSNPASEGMALAIAPSLGGLAIGAGGATVGVVSAQVPVLLGFPVGESEFVVAPKLHTFFFFGNVSGEGGSGGGTALTLNIGATAGYALKLGESFRLLPEVALLYPVVQTATAGAGGNGVSGTNIGGSGLLFQFTVALMFGGG